MGKFSRGMEDAGALGGEPHADMRDDIEHIPVSEHIADKNNPHETTAEQVGAVPIADFEAHTGDTDNPHGVTADQVGLGNVDNTSDMDKPVSTAQQAAINAVGGGAPHSCIVRTTTEQLGFTPAYGQALWCSTSNMSMCWAVASPGTNDFAIGIVTKVPTAPDTVYEITVVSIGASGFVACLPSDTLVGTPAINSVLGLNDTESNGVFRLTYGVAVPFPFNLYLYCVGISGDYTYTLTGNYSSGE